MSFTARENLKRTLEYRPHVRNSYRVLLGLACLGAALVVGFTLYFASSDPTLAAVIFFGGALGPLILLVEAHFLARPLATAKVHVRADGLDLERLGKSIDIHFSQVARVKFSHIPYLGGWFSLEMVSGEKYKFTVVLERSEYILEAISAVRPGIVRSEDLLAYRRTAILSDHSWARVYSKAQNRQGLVLKYLVLPALLTGVLLTLSRLPNEGIQIDGVIKVFALVWAMNLAIGLAVTFAFSELILVIEGKEKLLKDPSHVLRDIAFEKKVEMQALVGHWILTFAILAAVLLRL